ncbi:hypothetical protein ACI2KL_08215 [Pseudomonas yamanorum]|uniref:hypothetical protein n=1 Tax=Pseudomonas yamanorum TaxID=515393 RepID=UPI00384C51C6
MSILHRLQKATTLHDLAIIFNYTPASLAYLIYKKTNKYIEFDIPKSNGSKRRIMAPCDELKTLQRKIKKALDECLESIEKNPRLPAQFLMALRKVTQSHRMPIRIKKDCMFSMLIYKIFSAQSTWGESEAF